MVRLHAINVGYPNIKYLAIIALTNQLSHIIQQNQVQVVLQTIQCQ